MSVMELKGTGNVTLIIENDFIIIRRSGFSAAMAGKSGDKTIPYASIAAVQMKKPGFMAGHLQFTIPGSTEKSGIVDTQLDENTVTFQWEPEKWEEAKRFIEKRISESKSQNVSPAISVADELAKFAALRDQGVLTEEEFAKKKKELLGL